MNNDEYIDELEKFLDDSIEDKEPEQKIEVKPEQISEADDYFSGLDEFVAMETEEETYLKVSGTYKTKIMYCALKENKATGQKSISTKFKVVIGDHEDEIFWVDIQPKVFDKETGKYVFWKKNIERINALFGAGEIEFNEKLVANTPLENGRRTFDIIHDTILDTTVEFVEGKNGKKYAKNVRFNK